jgi:hypothetical protein
MKKSKQEQELRRRKQVQPQAGGQQRPQVRARPQARPAAPAAGGGSPLDQLARQLEEVLKGGDAQAAPQAGPRRGGAGPAGPQPAAAAPAAPPPRAPVVSEQRGQAPDRRKSSNRESPNTTAKALASVAAAPPARKGHSSGRKKKTEPLVAVQAAAAPRSAPAEQIVDLLSSPQGATQAVILQEILRRPRMLDRRVRSGR